MELANTVDKEELLEKKSHDNLISKLSTYDESFSDGWEPKILDGFSLGTKIYDKVLKLSHNEEKQCFLDIC